MGEKQNNRLQYYVVLKFPLQVSVGVPEESKGSVE